MTDEHATSDELLDLALSQLDDSAVSTQDPKRVGDHVAECVACRVRLTRLRRAGGFEEPSDAVLDRIVADSPGLTDEVRTFIASASSAEPSPGEVWRVGLGDALLVWVRRIVNDSTVDVIPLAFDTEMADSESLFVPALATPLQVPLVALIGVRTHIHRDAFLNKLGVLNISESVEEIMAAAREGRPHAVAHVGPPIQAPGDRRIEFRQLMSDLLGDLSPIAYTARLKEHGRQEGSPGEVARQRVGSVTIESASAAVASEPDAARYDQNALFERLTAELTERLDTSVICLPSGHLTQETEAGKFAAFFKVHYIDTSVLVVLFDHEGEHLPEPDQAADGVASILEAEVDVQGIAVASPRDLSRALFMTRANLRPALELPTGTRSAAKATILGHTLVDTLVKFLDGEPAKWEVLERGRAQLPDFDIRAVARDHAQAALNGVRKTAGRSPQPEKKEAWGSLGDEVADTVSQFVNAARSGDLSTSLEILGLEER